MNSMECEIQENQCPRSNCTNESCMWRLCPHKIGENATLRVNLLISIIILHEMFDLIQWSKPLKQEHAKLIVIPNCSNHLFCRPLRLHYDHQMKQIFYTRNVQQVEFVPLDEVGFVTVLSYTIICSQNIFPTITQKIFWNNKRGN